MNLLSSFHFLRPTWLLALPVVIGLWWWRRSAEDSLRGWLAVMDRDLLQAMTTRPADRVGWRSTALLLGWILAVVAIAGPTWRPEPSPFADDPVPVMVLLKAGETMDLSDLLPRRMERARLKVADFAEQRKGQPLGLIAYAGSAHLVLPPTRDTAVVASMAAEIDPAIMPQRGDDLASALQLASRTLATGGGSIVVVTDTVGAANVAQLASFHAESNLPVHFLAVARPNTPEQNAIQQAASALHATVTLITPDTEDVRALVQRTATAPVAVGVSGEGTRWTESGWWLVPALALLSLASFRRTRNAAHGDLDAPPVDDPSKSIGLDNGSPLERSDPISQASTGEST